MLTNPVDSQWLILHNVDDTLPYAEEACQQTLVVSELDRLHSYQDTKPQHTVQSHDDGQQMLQLSLSPGFLVLTGLVRRGFIPKNHIDWILEGRYREEGTYCGRQSNSSLRGLFADSKSGCCVLPGNGEVTG